MNFKSIANKLFSDRQFTDPSVNDNSACFEINNWTISQFVVERLLSHAGFHPFPLNEQMLMTAAVCRIKPTHILEWGTNIGVSARIFYEICRAFSLTSEIHSIDLPDHECHQEHPGHQRGRLVRGLPEVRLHQGDGLDVALDILAAASQPARMLFFLDGDHSYNSVRRELDALVGRPSTAGILVHDTFYQSEQSGYNTGPYRAVREIIKDTGETFDVYAQDLGLPGMTLLWRRT